MKKLEVKFIKKNKKKGRATKKASKSKTSKLYKKKYRGQGR
jgi:hypothetical protein